MKHAVLWSVAAVLAASVEGAASTAYAWEPIAGTKALAPRWSCPMVYRINEAGSDDLDIDVLLTEVHKGMLEWTTPDCTSATARYDGLTAELPGTAEEPGADNVIAWRESDWTDGPQAVAITAPSFISTGSGPPVIVAATMRLNGQHWTWVTGESEGQRINLLSVMLHEAGHYWGLGHTLVPMSVMNDEYSQDLTGLGTDDIEGICSLYPLGEVEDCTARPCPGGYDCVDGNCLWKGAGAPLQGCEMDGGCDEAERCDAGSCVDDAGGCVVDGDCASGDERCIAGRCTRMSDPPPEMCIRDDECGADEACKAGVCVALDPGDPVGLPVGSDCVMDSDCESGLCRFDGEATQCTAFCETDRDCGTDARCLRDGTQTGLCGPEEPEAEPQSQKKAETARDAETAGCGCSTARSSGPTALLWPFLVPFVLLRTLRARIRARIV
ncbi:MAG: matrixin family metalloprotease [Deltaproteobacteria bacterium]|nr:matrixin family metalloprotease [Deltaproteobacteria bacterium]